MNCGTVREPMPPKPRGPRPLTNAERQALLRARKAEQELALKVALQRVRDAKTLREAVEIATDALLRT